MDATATTASAPELTQAKIQPRYPEIDGLRGWACVSVMLSHLFFGVFINADPPFIAPEWRPLMEPFLGGTLAVAVFFTLSGDVLSASYWTHPSRSVLVRHLVKRYVRLTIPILGASSVVLLLIKAGLTFQHQAAAVLHVEEWLGNVLQGGYGVLDVVWFACVTVFFDTQAERAFIPFLWVIRYEMVGSLLVLVYLFADGQIRRRYTAIVFMLLICLGADSMLACFPLGMLCAIARAKGGFAWLRRWAGTEPIALLGFALALVVGTWCNRTWQGFLAPSIIAGGVAVVCVYASRWLTRAFSAPVSLWLGRISFPIFLLHFPVIVSFTSGMAVLAYAHGLLSPAMIWLIVAASAGVCLAMSRLFRPVETWAARAGTLACTVMLR